MKIPIGKLIGSSLNESLESLGDSIADAYRGTADFFKRNYSAIAVVGAALPMILAANVKEAKAGPPDCALKGSPSPSIVYATPDEDSNVIDINWRLAPDYSNIGYLVAKTSLDAVLTRSGVWEHPSGDVVFTNDLSDVPSGWKLFFLDIYGQPVGIYTVLNGSYSAQVFGNDLTTTDGTGAPIGSIITGVAEGLSNDFYNISIVPYGITDCMSDYGITNSTDLVMEDCEAYTGLYDIEVGDYIGPPPTIMIESTTNGIVVTWKGTLQTTTNLLDASSWADSAAYNASPADTNGVKSLIITYSITEMQMFFRARSTQ